jgi:hypothetical protein
MVVVEIHERLGEKMLVLLMKVLMLRCALIEGRELMHHSVLNHNYLALMFHLTVQNLLELVLQPLVLLVSSQMLDLSYFPLLYLFQFVGARQLHFVCFLFDLFVELVAFPVVVVGLQGLVL